MQIYSYIVCFFLHYFVLQSQARILQTEWTRTNVCPWGKRSKIALQSGLPLSPSAQADAETLKQLNK